MPKDNQKTKEIRTNSKSFCLGPHPLGRENRDWYGIRLCEFEKKQRKFVVSRPISRTNQKNQVGFLHAREMNRKSHRFMKPLFCYGRFSVLCLRWRLPLLPLDSHQCLQIGSGQVI